MVACCVIPSLLLGVCARENRSQLDSVFLSFELDVLTSEVGPYIKSKLIKSSIRYKNFKTLIEKRHTSNLEVKFAVFCEISVFIFCKYFVSEVLKFIYEVGSIFNQVNLILGPTTAVKT